MNRSPIVQQLLKRIDKWDFMKVKHFCTAKDRVTRLKRQPKNRKKIFAAISDKGLKSRIYRELKKLTLQRINNSLNKWANKLNRK
jgi:hypothetical protein